MSGLTSRASYRSRRPAAPASGWRHTCRVRFITCSSAWPAGRSRTRAVPCGAPAACRRPRTPRPPRTRSARRRASPRRSAWYSVRKCPPQDSSRSSASRHISSANSRKSATRPAFSSDWFSSSPVPSTFTSRQNSARSSGIRASAARSPSAFRAMPHCSQSSLPSSRWKESTVRVPRTASSLFDPLVDLGHHGADLGVRGVHRGEFVGGEVVADGVREDEVAVGQALHQRAGAEPVGAVVGEVGLADHEQARDGAHQVVVHPEPAHGVVDGRIDPHRHLVRVLVGDPLVHLEEVAVPLPDGVLAEPGDGVGEVEIDAAAAGAHAAAVVADLLGGPGGDVARGEVAEAGVLPLEVVVALGFGNLTRRPRVALLLRHPDPAVVAQRLAHQGELGLVVARHRDAGRVDLREAGVGEGRAALVGAVGGGDVAALGVGREVEDVAVAAGAEHHGVAEPGLDLRRSPGRGSRCRAPARR